MERQTELQSMDFQESMTEIGNKIRPHEVKIFKHKLKLTEKIPPSLLDDIDSRERNSGLTFLKKLQEGGYLAEDNLELLKELLLTMERHDLLRELLKFEKKIKTSSDVEGAVVRETEVYENTGKRYRAYKEELGIEEKGSDLMSHFEGFHLRPPIPPSPLYPHPAHQSIFQRAASYISNLWGSISGRGRRTTTSRTRRSYGRFEGFDSLRPPSGYVSESLWGRLRVRTSTPTKSSVRASSSESSGYVSGSLSLHQGLHSYPSEELSIAEGLEDCKVISESKNVAIDVEGSFHDLSSFGVLLQVPPNAVTHPTVFTCRKIPPDRIRLPTEENETLVSNCVYFESNSIVGLQKPIIVTLAHSGPNKKEGYETIVKELRDSWEQKKEIREDSPLAREHFNSAYIRVEITIKGTTGLAVFTRLIKDTFEVTHKGCVVRSSVCEDVTVEFPEGAVDKTYIGSLKLLLMPDHIDILDGRAAYPCQIIFIDGFGGVNFTTPVKIKLPHPYPEGYPTGNVRLLTMDAPHNWKDITNEVRCVETESFIELQVSHFSGLWASINEVPSTVASRLSRYLFKAPQDVSFAVFKENEVCSNVLLTMTLVCVPNHKQFETKELLEKQGYTRLASSTGSKNMRPGDKAYTKVKGCYEKVLDEEIVLRFIKNDIFITELTLVKKRENEETNVDNATGIVLFISFLEKKDDDSKDSLCTFCIHETRIVPPEPSKKLSSTEPSLVLQKVETVGLESAPPEPSGLCSSETEDRPSKRISASEAASCKELEICFKDLSLATIDTNEAALKVADLLNLDKVSMKNPPEEVVVRCREFCSYLKSNERDDIVKKMRDLLPSGMTGPLTNENVLVRDMIGKLKGLTRSLCGDDLWKTMADHLGCHFGFYENKRNPAKSILEDVCRKRRLTIGDLYDVLCKCDANALADEFL